MSAPATAPDPATTVDAGASPASAAPLSPVAIDAAALRAALGRCRIVVERLQSSTSTSNKRILFQLEFVGFTRLGSNALQSLKQNIPHYQFLREQVTIPSRFSNYD